MHLTHLTLNTGHVSREPIQELAPGIRAQLRRLISSGGGMLPGPFAAFCVDICTGSGTSAFTLFRAKVPVVTCACAWESDQEQVTWYAIEKLYLELSDQVPGLMAATAAPERPGDLPWLAVILLPGIGLCAREDIGWLGDFERCLAAELIRSSPSEH
jgi:hypothetical protein